MSNKYSFFYKNIKNLSKKTDKLESSNLSVF